MYLQLSIHWDGKHACEHHMRILIGLFLSYIKCVALCTS